MTFKKQTEALSERIQMLFSKFRFDSSDSGDPGGERDSDLYLCLSFSLYFYFD